MARTKQVYPTEEIPHLWAHQRTNGLESARNPHGNLYFKDGTIFSYGPHFPIARFVERHGDTAVLFNIEDASQTTSKHKGLVRAAIPPQYDVFTVPLFTVPLSHSFDVQNAVNDYLVRAAALRDKAGKARTAVTKGRYFHELSDLTREANTFARFYEIPHLFAVDNPTDLPDDYFNRLVDEARAQAEQRNLERMRKLEAENQQRIERWLAGENVWFPQMVAQVCLRIKGDQVETSRGVAFPVKHALRALKLIEKAHANETAILARNGRPVARLGDYQIDEIDEDGNVRAGCHFVTYDEIQRIAPQLKSAKPNAP